MMAYDFQFGFLTEYWDALAYGLGNTLLVTIVSIAFGLTLGFLISLTRLSANPLIYWAGTAYVEFFRGTPVLIQLFWIFFCMPLLLGIELDNFTSSVIALTLYMAAISSEAFRSALRSIEPEQYDAAHALGLTPWVRVGNVVLPQALLRATPTLLSNSVSLFKESALVSAVGMADLMYTGQNISNTTARPVEVLTAVAAIYFLVAFPLTRAVTRMETTLLRRMAL